MKKLLFTCLLIGYTFLGIQAQEPFNPDNPPEPMVKYHVSISADPADATSAITFGGAYNIGHTITISVTPAYGYRFLHWTKDGEQYTSDQTFDFTIADKDVVFVAKLAKNPVITVSVSPEGAGAAYGGGAYAPGASRQISTSANTGYTFLYWTLNGEEYTAAGTEMSFYYTVGDEDVAFVAVYKKEDKPEEPETPFEPESPAEPLVYYPVKVSTDLPDGVQPISIASNGYYAPGKYMSLFVTPPTGYSFLHWTLNDEFYSDQTSCPYTVGDSAATFVAHFAIKYTIALTVNPAEAGTVSGAGTYLPGDKVLLTTSPKTGWVFLYWTLNDEQYADAASFYYIIGETNVAFEAVYVKEEDKPEDPNAPFNPPSPPEPKVEKEALFIQARANDSKLGFVSGLPTTPLFEGDEITLEAVSTNEDGYYFTKWENGSTDNPRTITLTENASYVAYFAKYQFTVTFVDENEEVLDERLWDYGDMPSCVSPAKAEDEEYTYKFSGWQPALQMVTADATYQATYEPVEKIKDYTPQNLQVTLTEIEGDTQIDFTWDQVDGVAGYAVQLGYNDELSDPLPATTNAYTLLLSQVLMQYNIDPGTYSIDWYVICLDALAQPLCEWTQGESFEITVPDPGPSTGIDLTPSLEGRTGEGVAQKLLRDGRLYIIINDRTYDVTGKRIE